MTWIIRVILGAVFLVNGFTAVHAQVPDKVVTFTLNPAKAAGGKEVVITASEPVFRTEASTNVWFYKRGETTRILTISGRPILPEGYKKWVEIIPGGEKVPSILITQQLSFVVPEDLEPGRYEVGVNIGREQKRTPFTVLSEVVKISPKEGNHSTLIDIVGNGFGFTADNTVYLDRDDGFDTYPGNAKLEIVTALPKKLKVAIPGQTPIGSYLVRVYTKEEESEYQNQKFLLRPHLTVLLPLPGEIAVGGLYFHQDKSKIKILLYQGGEKKGETLVEELLPPAVVSAKVPSFLPSGLYEVMVAVEDIARAGTFIESDNSLQLRIFAAPTLTPALTPTPTLRPSPTPTQPLPSVPSTSPPTETKPPLTTKTKPEAKPTLLVEKPPPKVFVREVKPEGFPQGAFVPVAILVLSAGGFIYWVVRSILHRKKLRP